MASEIGIGAAQCERILAKPAGDQETVDDGCAGLQAGRGGALLNDASGVEEGAGIAIRRREDQRRARRCAGKTRRIGDHRGNIAVEVHRVTPGKGVAMPDFPTLMHEPMRQTFAACLSPKDKNAPAEKPGGGSKVDPCLSPHPGAVEQDRFGRQKFEPSACADRQMLRDRGRRAGRAIDLLGGRGRHMRSSPLPHLNVNREPIAGDETARSRQQDCEIDIAGLGRGEQDAQRIALIQMRKRRVSIPPGKADLGDADRLGALTVRARSSYPRSGPRFRAMMWKMCQCFGSPSLVVPG